MAKKVATHRRHVGGMEAPRNSLELPVETSYGVYSGRENILYAYHVAKESSDKNCRSTEAPIKKLISDEISKGRNTRQTTPSVVARLMGVDMLPFDSKPAARLVDIETESPAVQFLGKQRSKKGSVGHDTSMLSSSLQLDFGSFGEERDRYSDQCSSHMMANRPKPREHPQEEELQKFKRDFEAWQVARFKECSKVVEVNCPSSQLIAQEDLHREKMFQHVNSKRVATSERPMEPKDPELTADTNEMLISSHNQGKRHYHFPDEAREYHCSNRSRTDYRPSQLMDYKQEPVVVSAPTKIVILKPGPDRIGISEDSCNSSPSSSEDRGDIKDFLEEVKERLKYELQGKSCERATTVRGGGIETPYREKPSEPRQIAQRIAQQVRDSVTRDLGMNLLRSESTRSYRSDTYLNGTGSPEFINKDTRKFLAEKLRNVLKGEMRGEVSSSFNDKSRSSVFDYKKGTTRQSRETHIERKMDYPESIAFGLEKQSRSVRRESGEGAMPHQDMSPRNLIRSLSAPVSGTSFGKLLLEDRHILTGAQIRRKHEVTKKISMNVGKQKRDKFNIREKVSSFRYSLTLRGRLFRRRVQLVEGSHPKKHDVLNDISSGPTVMRSFYETHENSTEVPPSPASVCSSVHEEFWRSADYSSPTTSSTVYPLEDNEMPYAFKEINSNLNELRRKINQLEGSVLSDEIIEEQPDEAEMEIEDQSEAYVKDLLVASGLYDGSCNRSLSKWDPLGKPISNQVFEEVEESYRQSTEDCVTGKDDLEENLNHRILLDLLNEELPAILNPRTNMSRSMEKAIGPVRKPPRGRKLLFHVWEIIKDYVHPPADRFYFDLDNMLARDLKPDPWTGLIDDDINFLNRDIECQIIGDLIVELVEDMR